MAPVQPLSRASPRAPSAPTLAAASVSPPRSTVASASSPRLAVSARRASFPCRGSSTTPALSAAPSKTPPSCFRRSPVTTRQTSPQCPCRCPTTARPCMAASRGLRIGVPRDHFFGLLDPEVRVAVEEAHDVFRALGAEVMDVDAGYDRMTVSRHGPSATPRARPTTRSGSRSSATTTSPELLANLSTALPDAVGLAKRLPRQLRHQRVGPGPAGKRRPPPGADHHAPGLAHRREEWKSMRPAHHRRGVCLADHAVQHCRRARTLAPVRIFGRRAFPSACRSPGARSMRPTVLRAAHAYETATDWHRRTPQL